MHNNRNKLFLFNLSKFLNTLTMERYKIGGYTVWFPYKPYPAQIQTMETMLKSFGSSKCALIESPTGTGKSLAILCAVMGYLEKKDLNDIIDPKKRRIDNDTENFVNNNRIGNPTIYICSRTHKQIDQLINQLRKTKYNPRISILGSRKQYCINSQLRRALDINTACKDLIDTKRCIYKSGVSRLKKQISNIYDIEEIRNSGKKCGGCPYFASREIANEAEIIFAPYNYIIDPHIRKSLDIELKNAIVIIDEAHNIEDTCRSVGSFELNSRTLDIWMSELLSNARKAILLEGSIENDFLQLSEFIKKFKTKIDIQFEKSRDFHYKVFKGTYMIEQLKILGITQISLNLFQSNIKNIRDNEKAKALLSQNLQQGLESLDFVLKNILTNRAKDEYIFCFKQFVKDKSFAYCFWLLDPSIIFAGLRNEVRSIILLYGTLTPFATFTSELKVNFENKLIAPHILVSNQVFVANIKKGHLKTELTGTYSIANTPEYLSQIATIIENIATQVHIYGGTLVFVPSYVFLKKLHDKMKLPVIVEPDTNSTEKFDATLIEYENKLKDSSHPAIFFCVYRGKASEGINFQDKYARAVIGIGIPYPSINDPQITTKKEYNSTIKNFGGSEWYMIQAIRAVNQALGRIVRHPGDWGAVFLLETRYQTPQIRKQLPQWITRSIKDYDTFDDCKNDFIKFLSEKKN